MSRGLRPSSLEAAMVLARRAAEAYAAERLRPDPTLDEPRDGDLVHLEIDMDWSGRLRVTPADPNDATFTAASWTEIEEAPDKIASATRALVQEREDRQAGIRVGDPRRGRRRVAEDCDGMPEEVSGG